MSTVRVATPGARTATPGVTVVRSRAPASQQIRVIGTGQQVVKTGTGQVMTPVKIVSQQSLQGTTLFEIIFLKLHDIYDIYR